MAVLFTTDAYISDTESPYYADFGQRHGSRTPVARTLLPFTANANRPVGDSVLIAWRLAELNPGTLNWPTPGSMEISVDVDSIGPNVSLEVAFGRQTPSGGASTYTRPLAAGTGVKRHSPSTTQANWMANGANTTFFTAQDTLFLGLRAANTASTSQVANIAVGPDTWITTNYQTAGDLLPPAPTGLNVRGFRGDYTFTCRGTPHASSYEVEKDGVVTAVTAPVLAYAGQALVATTFRARALNALGAGPWSAPVTYDPATDGDVTAARVTIVGDWSFSGAFTSVRPTLGETGDDVVFMVGLKPAHGNVTIQDYTQLPAGPARSGTTPPSGDTGSVVIDGFRMRAPGPEQFLRAISFDIEPAVAVATSMRYSSPTGLFEVASGNCVASYDAATGRVTLRSPMAAATLVEGDVFSLTYVSTAGIAHTSGTINLPGASWSTSADSNSAAGTDAAATTNLRYYACAYPVTSGSTVPDASGSGLTYGLTFPVGTAFDIAAKWTRHRPRYPKITGASGVIQPGKTITLTGENLLGTDVAHLKGATTISTSTGYTVLSDTSATLTIPTSTPPGAYEIQAGLTGFGSAYGLPVVVDPSSDRTGSGALAGSGSLVEQQVGVTVKGTDALAGSGSLVETQAGVAVAGTDSLSGSGSLVETGRPGLRGATVLAGSGSLFVGTGPRPGTERYAPDVVLQQSGLTGTLSAITDNPADPDGTWMTSSAAISLRLGFPTPAGQPLAGTQTVRVLVREGA